MRLKLYEDAIRAKSKSSKGDKSIDPDDSDDSHTEAASPTRAAADPPVPAERTGPMWTPFHSRLRVDLLGHPRVHQRPLTRVL